MISNKNMYTFPTSIYTQRYVPTYSHIQSIQMSQTKNKAKEMKNYMDITRKYQLKWALIRVCSIDRRYKFTKKKHSLANDDFVRLINVQHLNLSVCYYYCCCWFHFLVFLQISTFLAIVVVDDGSGFRRILNGNSVAAVAGEFEFVYAEQFVVAAIKLGRQLNGGSWATVKV